MFTQPAIRGQIRKLPTSCHIRANLEKSAPQTVRRGLTKKVTRKDRARGAQTFFNRIFYSLFLLGGLIYKMTHFSKTIKYFL